MLKSQIVIQYQGHEISEEALIAQAKEYWKQAGHKIGEIESLDIYVKPEEFSAYYSINQEEQKGRISF